MRQPKGINKQAWINAIWVLLTITLLVPFLRGIVSGKVCHQMGVDFRGYYSSGQIALQHGFSQVYNQELQKDFQADLYYRCPTPPEQPPLYVGMPYLPLYVLFFLPFTLVDFTASYFIWLGLQFIIFLFYLYRFSRAFGTEVSFARVFQWGFCIPLISNLYLGQINTLLVIFTSEFLIAYAREKEKTAGFWLSALMIKPHTLILVLPGFVLRRKWIVLLTFSLGAAAIVSLSFLLGGFNGLLGVLQTTYQFTGSLIQTVHGMVNWRALALNLDMVIPTWAAILVAAVGGGTTLILVLWIWVKGNCRSKTSRVWLMAVTLFGTLTISWHSHFYMLMLLVPLLLYLDASGILSPPIRNAWLLGPPAIYLGAHFINPAFERNLFGMGMLILSFSILVGLLKLGNSIKTHSTL
jgi:hypothetical protein